MLNLNVLRKFTLGKLFSYPHFNADDSLLLDRFWDNYPDKMGICYYDVPLIDDNLKPDTDIPSMIADWKYLKALKIDFIILKAPVLYLYEVKPLLDMKAIGQVVSYRAMLPICYDFTGTIMSYIICEFARAELKVVCSELNINVIFV